jgi:hypothetical protein
MKPQVYSQTGAGTTSSFVVNTNATPVNIGIAVVVSGTVNYTVQHTYDSPQSGFTTWFNDATLAAQTATGQTSITYPITGLQLVVNSGTGTATMTVVQAGIA